MSNEHAQENSTRVIYACDVGSTRTNPSKFAWSRVEPKINFEVVGSPNICALAAEIGKDLERGYSVALGFEAPLFLPVPESADNLSRGRQGEGNRSFAAPPGAAVTTLGAHQAAWLLRRLFLSCGSQCAFTLDPRAWPPFPSQPVLLCWEAFVAGTAHSTSGEQAHIRDAATAAIEFLNNEYCLIDASAVTAEQPFSLIGAIALWSGWTTSLQVLEESALVIKPTEPYTGPISIVQ